MLFDTHAHIDDAQFDSDRNKIIDMLPGEGISYIIDPGCDIESSRTAIELSKKNDYIYAAVGIQPENAGNYNETLLNDIESMLNEDKVCAVGEIGLDYHYETPDREIQKRCFIDQVELACRHKMPIIIHDRDAHKDTIDILTDRRSELSGGVMHCYSGSWEMAKQLLKMGFYIAFGGALTFKNAGKLTDIAASVPSNRLLIETDCPYMAPVPVRGTRNYPGNVKYVAKRLSEIRNVSFDEICSITLNNAKKLFNID